MEKDPGNGKKGYCRIHEDEQETWYCLTENTRSCNECLAEKHEGHTCKTAKNLSTNIKKELEAIIIEEKKHGGGYDPQIAKLKERREKQLQYLKEKEELLLKVKTDMENIIAATIAKERQLSDEFVKKLDNQLREYEELSSDKSKKVIELNEELKKLDDFTKKAAAKYSEIFDFYEKYCVRKEASPKATAIAKTEEVKSEILEEVKNPITLEPLIPVECPQLDVDKKRYDQCVRYVEKTLADNYSHHTMQTLRPLVLSYSCYESEIITYDLERKICNRIDLVDANSPFKIPYNSCLIEVEGIIHITGGTENGRAYIAKTYAYSILSGKMRKNGDLKEARSEHSMVYADGMLFCVGGRKEKEHLNSCEILTSHSLTGATWEIWPYNLNEKKSQPSLCTFSTPSVFSAERSDPRKYTIYCFGGISKGVVLDTIEVINLSLKEGWKKVVLKENAFNAHVGSAAIQVNENEILLFGGCSKRTEETDQTFIYNVAEGKIILSALKLPKPADFTESRPTGYTITNDKNTDMIIGIIGHHVVYEWQIGKESWKSDAEAIWGFPSPLNP